MDTRPFYAGRWLKAEHLDPTKDTVMTIADVTAEKVGDDDDEEGAKTQVCLHFDESKQILGLNATNARTLWDLFGYDSDDWLDKRIALWVDPHVQFGKKVVEGVRIRPRTPAATKRARKAKPATSTKGDTSEQPKRRRGRQTDRDGD